MLYLVTQIILCLLFTALIGIAVGWLLRGIGSSRHSDMVAAEWRARVAQLESKQATAAPVEAAAPPAEAGASGPGHAELDALRQRLADSERELATLRTARAVRTQTEGDTTREELREARIVCQQLQGRMAEQRTLNEQLEKRLQIAAKERDTLVRRLRELETNYARLTQERQHAVETIAGLQKDLRAKQPPRPAAAPGGGSAAGQPGPAADAGRESARPQATQEQAARARAARAEAARAEAARAEAARAEAARAEAARAEAARAKTARAQADAAQAEAARATRAIAARARR